jgi:hypothetical protein
LVAGLWAASVHGGDLRLLEAGDARVVEWISPNEVLIDHFAMGCDTYDLDVLDPRSGIASTIWRGSFLAAAANSDGSVVLLGSPYEQVGDDPFGCRPVLAQGLYVIRLPGGTPQRIGDFDPDSAYGHIEWLSSQEQFVISEYPRYSQFTFISPQGDVVQRNPYMWAFPDFSPSGPLWIINGGLTLQVFDPEEGLVAVVSGSFCRAIWRPDGEAIFFADDENLYMAGPPDYDPVLALSGLTGLCESQMVWLAP